MDFVTSDTHFGHANCIHFDSRPFADADQMDAEIIDRWNTTVKNRNKDVFHLGDFAFLNKRPIEWYVQRLYGRIHLIFGNHDDKGARRHRDLFESTHEALYLRHNNQRIWLCHYACRSWRSAYHGSLHLYGHSHGRLPCIGRSMDVGIMLHGYASLSFSEINDRLATQPVVCPDHAL